MILAVGVVLPVLLAAALLAGCEREPKDGMAIGPTVGRQHPSLTVEFVRDPPGTMTGDLETTYGGKVLVVGFWLGGCAPCLDEMPELVALHRRYASQGVKILLINVGGNREVVQKVIDDNDIPFAMALDTLSLMASRYQVGVFPTTFVIDRSGVIRARLAGTDRPGRITDAVTALL